MSRLNQHEDVLNQLRATLVGIGVKNWVLHIAVEGGARAQTRAGGQKKGRTYERHPSRGTKLQETLLSLFKENEESPRKLDIRWRYTNSTPNSVVLVDSKGDLYTEDTPIMARCSSSKPEEQNLTKFGPSGCTLIVLAMLLGT